MKEPMLGRYRNSEFLQYMKDVLELVNRYDVATLQLTTQLNVLASITHQMETVFEQDQRNEITQELLDLDTKRGNVLRGAKLILEGCTYHSDVVIKNAAKKLLHNLHSYGTNIPRMNYQSETAVIDSMLAEWETEVTLSAALNLVPIATWISELKTVNSTFNDRYLARIKEVAENPIVSFYSLRTDGAAMYRALVSRLKAYMILGETATYQEIVNEIYELAKLYNQTVKMRAKY
ncbi:hypothetical protein H2O64_21295 [Kordia sp. YSTF-M3]|uniref:Uncharacterized protein n=1 Tax=Kordia aestuariivivens TaxID=2759037 RepID=A0ABR7QFZ6_9FLAO|nr:DUF6261 family protein [Kordia aestuariivivens]MBC8757219.1 hypothetical protein [Kordia aestuariivivens]